MVRGAPELRRIVLMRHAKSSWDSSAESDHARPLNERGRRDAPRIARRLRELGWVPDLVVSSDAARTRETWELMRAELGELPARFTPALYLAGVDAARAVVAKLPSEVATALLLGHNPGWERLAATYSGEEVPLGTANAILLSVHAATWSAAAGMDGAWSSAGVLRPREI